MRIINEPRETLLRYIVKKIGHGPRDAACVVFGLVNDDDEIVAVAAFHNYEKPSIAMSIAAERLTPAFMAAIMRYAFIQCGCERITGVVDKKNHASRKFSLHLGAKLEGCLRRATPRGDLLIYGLLKSEASKWLQESYREKLEVLCHS